MSEKRRRLNCELTGLGGAPAGQGSKPVRRFDPKPARQVPWTDVGFIQDGSIRQNVTFID